MATPMIAAGASRSDDGAPVVGTCVTVGDDEEARGEANSSGRCRPEGVHLFEDMSPQVSLSITPLKDSVSLS